MSPPLTSQADTSRLARGPRLTSGRADIGTGDHDAASGLVASIEPLPRQPARTDPYFVFRILVSIVSR